MGLPAGPWHKVWRQAVWLTILVAYIYAAATVGTVTRHAPAETVSRVSAAVVLGIAFFWWGLRFLVGGRVSYAAALPGAVVTMVLLGRWFHDGWLQARAGNRQQPGQPGGDGGGDGDGGEAAR